MPSTEVKRAKDLGISWSYSATIHTKDIPIHHQNLRRPYLPSHKTSNMVTTPSFEKPRTCRKDAQTVPHAAHLLRFSSICHATKSTRRKLLSLPTATAGHKGPSNSVCCVSHTHLIADAVLFAGSTCPLRIPTCGRVVIGQDTYQPGANASQLLFNVVSHLQ